MCKELEFLQTDNLLLTKYLTSYFKGSYTMFIDLKDYFKQRQNTKPKHFLQIQ